LSQALPFDFLVLFLIGLGSFFLLSFLFLPNQQIFLVNKINKKLVFFLILLVILGIECFFVFFIQFDVKNFTFVRGFGEKGRDISFETKNVIYRFTFYRDALKMIQKKPLLGWGGGGWAARYFSFQSHTYYTKFPHSFYLNTLVESGVLGLVPLLFLLFYSLYICIISTNQNQSISIIPYLGAGVFLIFLHSSIDLNFAMGAYHIFAWTLLGLLLSFYPLQKLKLSIPLIIPLLLTLIFFILSIFLGNAEYYYQSGNEYRAGNDFVHSAKAWETAVRLNPWHDNVLYQLSNLSSDIYLQTKKEEFLNLALEKNQKALNIEPYNYEYYRHRADLFLLKGEVDEAWKDYKYSMELAPMVLGNYEKILFAFLNLLNSQQKSINPNTLSQIKVYTDEVFHLYLENQLKSTQPNPPSEALNFLKRDIDTVLGGGNTGNSITED
jgi:tetratricopeptide (TPR) repeat protein